MWSTVIKPALRSIDRMYRAPLLLRARLEQWQDLHEQDYTVVFPLEGNQSLRLPRITLGSFLSDYLSTQGLALQRSADFAGRPGKEALLRKIVHHLFQAGYLDRSKSVIDIGCWIADNSLIWARGLSSGAVVHAIDPSEDNLAFGRSLARLNDIRNVNWVRAVCSDRADVALQFTGDITHATFSESKDAGALPDALRSTTLDEIVGRAQYDRISLLHVDVEGFEEKVIRGAAGILERSKPAIIFEQHIAQEDNSSLVGYLRSKGYSIYMINEVLPECRLDCRNFLAVHASRPLPELPAAVHSQGSAQKIWYAALEGPLIPVGEAHRGPSDLSTRKDVAINRETQIHQKSFEVSSRSTRETTHADAEAVE